MLFRKTNGQHFTSQLFHGHVDVAKVLIQNGADVNAVDERQMDSTSLRSSERTC